MQRAFALLTGARDDARRTSEIALQAVFKAPIGSPSCLAPDRGVIGRNNRP